MSGCRRPPVFCKAVSWFALAVSAVKFYCLLLVSQGLLRPCLASKFHHVRHFSFMLFQCGGFKSAIKCHQICNQFVIQNFLSCIMPVTKNQFVQNGFMKRSYLDIPDLLQVVAAVVKLQEKSRQRYLLIYHLCCCLHSRRNIRRILRICKCARIS